MNQPRPSARNAAPPQTPAQNGAQALAERARTARQHNRFVEAKSLAEQAIRMHRKNALAYEVLGDVYRLQNKIDDAMNMYTVALQLNPANAPPCGRVSSDWCAPMAAAPARLPAHRRRKSFTTIRIRGGRRQRAPRPIGTRRPVPQRFRAADGRRQTAVAALRVRVRRVRQRPCA